MGLRVRKIRFTTRSCTSRRTVAACSSPATDATRASTTPRLKRSFTASPLRPDAVLACELVREHVCLLVRRQMADAQREAYLFAVLAPLDLGWISSLAQLSPGLAQGHLPLRTRQLNIKRPPRRKAPLPAHTAFALILGAIIRRFAQKNPCKRLTNPQP